MFSRSSFDCFACYKSLYGYEGRRRHASRTKLGGKNLGQRWIRVGPISIEWVGAGKCHRGRSCTLDRNHPQPEGYRVDGLPAFTWLRRDRLESTSGEDLAA